MKLRALAQFTETYGEEFHRIEALAEVDGWMRVVDIQIEPIRRAILAGKQVAVEIYRSGLAMEYDIAGRSTSDRSDILLPSDR